MAKKITEESLRLNIIVNGDAARKALLDQEEAVRKNSSALKDLKLQQEKLSKAGDTSSKKYRTLSKAIEDQQKVLDRNTASLEKMRRQQSLTSMTMGELRKHTAMVRSALSAAVPGTENFKRLQRELREARNRMHELQNQTTATETTLNSMAGHMRDYAIAVGAGIMAGRQLYSQVQQATDAYREQDEAMTDVMKTTNLTKEEVMFLNEELKKLDTRTAQNDLLALARIAGKLGITGQEDILAFVAATDKINVALKEDLGGDTEGAIRSIGKLVDIFQLQGEYGLEAALLKTGSAINTLGMSSTANEGYIVDFTSRLAGIAPNANIAIDKVLGLAATLDKYGQQAETAGTAIGQVIMAMFKRTDVFAGIAKMELKEFTDLLNNDVNEALLRVLEGMRDGGGLASVVKYMEEMHLNGQRASTILGTLAKNTAELRNQQDIAADSFEKGISLQEEFNTKNTSATAIAEKHKKAIEEQVVAIGQRLLPVANQSMKLAEMGLKSASALIGVMFKYKTAILAVAAAYAAYVISQKAAIAADKMKNFWSKANRLALAEEVATLKGASAATIALSAAKNLLAGNLKAAGAAFKLFGASIKTAMGPVGWIMMALQAILALMTPFIRIWRRHAEVNRKLADTNRDLADSYADVNLQISEEKSRLDRLRKSALEAKMGSDERAKAIKAINDQYGDYLPCLLNEKSSNVDIATALSSVNDQLERKLKLQAKEKGLADIQANLDEQTKESMEEFSGRLQKSIGKGLTADEQKAMNEAIISYRREMALFFKKYENHTPSGDAEKIRIDQEKQEIRSKVLFDTYQKMGGTFNNFRLPRLTATLNDLDKVIVSGMKATNVLDQLYGAGNSGPSGSTSGMKPTGGTAPSDVTTTEQTSPADQTDKKVQELERLIAESRKIISAGEQDARAAEEKRYQEEISRFQDHKDDLIASGIDYTQLMATIERKHQTNLSQIDLKSFDDRKRLVDQEHELERTKLQNRHALEMDEAIRAGEDVTEIKERQARELADIDMKYAVQLQDLLDEIVSTDGTINLDIKGLSVEELNALKIKLEEIKALRDQMSGVQTSPSGEERSSEDSGQPSGNGRMLGLSQDEWTALFDAGTSGWERMGLAAAAFGDIANQSMRMVEKSFRRQEKMERKQLREYQKNNDKKRASLEKRLDAGLMTEEQYNVAIKAMDTEYEAFEEEMALKQAKREKALALTQAIINTALGVTMALSSMAPPLNFVNAGIVSAMGAVEIAMIASTPIEGAESGGRIFVRRKQDGKPYDASLSPDKRGLITSPTILIGENGSEYVIPADGVANPTLAPFIDTIEQARRAGTLKTLNFGSVYSPAVVAAGFASGGRTSRKASDPEISVESADIDWTELVDILQAISRKMDKPVPAVVSMLGPKGLVKSYDEYNRMKNNGKI